MKLRNFAALATVLLFLSVPAFGRTHKNSRVHHYNHHVKYHGHNVHHSGRAHHKLS